jgi:recombination protein RecT
MADTPTTTNGNKPVRKITIKDYMAAPQVQKRINEMLGKRASQFTTSVLSLTGNDELLSQADPQSLFNACLTAASMDLQINKNLGYAHIIGYRNNKKGIVEAQFQMGWKGFIQLAQRTGQYERIAATEVYEGQLIAQDPLDGNTYDWTKKTSEKVIGYVSRFTLTTGFKSELYMPKDEVDAHAKKYSQSYKMNYGPWKDNFDAMALKTVLKLNLNKYGPMSTELTRAIVADQAVIRDDRTDYIDGELADVKADDEQKNAIIDAAKADAGDGEMIHVVQPKADADQDKGAAAEDADAPVDHTAAAKKVFGKPKAA